MTTPTPNVPLLNKVLEWVEEQAALPKSQSLWRQGSWVRNFARQTEGHPCGTAFCFAGYACQVSPEVEWESQDTRYPFVTLESGPTRPVSVSEAAQQLLGLTDYQADDLFDGENSVKRIRKVVNRIINQEDSP